MALTPTHPQGSDMADTKDELKTKQRAKSARVVAHMNHRAKDKKRKAQATSG